MYFTSTRIGPQTVWKVPLTGGQAIQVSEGEWALESPDGTYVYYVQAANTFSPGTLWRVPATGGAPVKLLEGVSGSSFDVLDNGIYYIQRVDGETRLQYFDLAARKSITVAGNLGNADAGLTVSPNGRTILFSRVDSSVNDLMLVEDFR